MRDDPGGLLPHLKDIHVSLPAAALAALLLYLDTDWLVFYTSAAIAAHEAGHLAALALFGGRVESVYIGISGVEMRIADSMRLSYAKETVIRLAGPAVGLAAAVTCAYFGAATGNDGFYTLAGAGFALSAVNLVPVRCTDGGQALYYIICALKDPFSAQKVTAFTTCVSGGVIILAGIYALWRYKNITLLTFGIFILQADPKKLVNHCEKR